MRNELFTVLGAVELIAPKRLVEWGTEMAYESTDGLEVKRWVYPVVRLEGLFFLTTGIRGMRRERMEKRAAAERKEREAKMRAEKGLRGRMHRMRHAMTETEEKPRRMRRVHIK